MVHKEKNDEPKLLILGGECKLLDQKVELDNTRCRPNVTGIFDFSNQCWNVSFSNRELISSTKD